MVGITLSPEQLRGAPPEVRRWLEQQIANSLGLQYPQPHAAEPPSRHLVGCQAEEVKAILSLIQPLLPVVTVFFELAREPFAMSPQGLRVLQVNDIMRHCRLQNVNQVLACLETINGSLQRVSGDPEAALTAVDRTGHCLVADVTARSILGVWEEMTGGQPAAAGRPVQADTPPEPAQPAFQSPYPAAAMPASAMGGGPAE